MSAVLTGVDPLKVIDGGRVWLRGRGFTVPPSMADGCTVDGRPVRPTFASSDRLAVEVPAGLAGGRTEVKLADAPGATLYVDVGVVVATGVHQVDSPAIDRDGHVYATYSGTRGQEAPVAVYRVAPDGPREAFVMGLVNPTSLAFDGDGVLHVSSRFDGTVSRVFADGRYETVAADLGQACGLAFAPDGSMFVGDRSGTVFHIERGGRTRPLVTLPASVAAFHLALAPNAEFLYVTGPTLATSDCVYRVSMRGAVDVVDRSFGRPQGLAFDREGRLHVTEALAGVSGIYRLHEGGKTLVAGGPRLVGVSFGPGGDMVVATSDTIYRFTP